MREIPIIAELEKVFSHFNKHLFEGRLRLPVHIIQTDRKVVFRFEEESFHVVIGSEFAQTGDVFEHYLHEMVHIYNSFFDRRDCTANQYHNGLFLNVALDVGFFVGQHKTRGWSITSFTRPRKTTFHSPTKEKEKLRTEVLDSLPVDMKVILTAKKSILASLAKNPPKKCLLKYACGCKPPHNFFRSGVRPTSPNAPLAYCRKCGKQYRFVEE